ncbi:MAG: tripartite tricarboxylate transporter substrate binding protein [Betaproteobacteria bacterium]
MKSSPRHRCRITRHVLTLVVLSICMHDALAQSASSRTGAYPSRPIQIIVPFTPGTGMDILARTVGQKLGERMGQPVVVENRPGASGNIGAAAVAKAAPDGYTLLLSGNPLVMNVTLARDLPFDPVKDLAPIEKMATGTLAITVSNAVPANTVKEFVAYAKANPGKLAYGTPGVGTPQHLATELFKLTTGIDMLHVPYKGSAGAITGLMSGEIAFMFNAVHAVLPQAKAGKLRILAVASAKRSPAAPDVPTVAESGYPEFDVDLWYGLLAPAGTPKDVVARLNAEITQILSAPEMRETLAGQGLEAVTSTPEQFGALMNADLARWAKVIKEAGIKGE